MADTFQVRSFIGTHDKDWEDPRFFQHKSLELATVLEGRGLFRWNREVHTIEAGQTVVIPPHVPHSFHASAPIRFGVLLLSNLPAEYLSLFNSLLEGKNCPEIITLSQMDKEQYESLFRQWLRVMSSSLKKPVKTYLAWVQVLLLFFTEHSQKTEQALSITHIADYLRKHLQHGILISDLAVMAGLSEEGLRKRFHKVYQMTPKQFQHACRLAEAKWLLSSTDKDMQAIAEAIGFSQLHSFSNWFKKQEGTAPSEWRKSQRLYHM
ncbi:AraC family transcriptional regulator [Paenibacillus eucommiae]|uniref:AraC-like DNA-binding protein n=1 Tax=Paenibacillus eucommiae TaxID=1355755 RepID=A0ABS4ISK2_9BACL|nr:AraC family transcriptional regulator [Paenibacillus eucommiae]MBP1990547.1 AraC-like DNA-binding protein [Paenibacillus eucommiae]